LPIALQSEAVRGFGIVSIANLGGKRELMLTVNVAEEESVFHKESSVFETDSFFHDQSIDLQKIRVYPDTLNMLRKFL